MSHLPVIPDVILLDFLPEPGALQGLIAARRPGLVTQPAPLRTRQGDGRRPTPMAGFILLDFLPSLGALERVVRGDKTGAASWPQGGGHY